MTIHRRIKKKDEGKQLCYTSFQCHIYILMNCSIFVKESDDLSISDVRKQVHCNVCQEQVDHSDVEVVDQIPDDPQEIGC